MPIRSGTRRLCRAHSLGRTDLNAAKGCRPLVQQRIHMRGTRAKRELASDAPRPRQQPQFAVDGLDVARPRTLGPYAVVHTSHHVTGRGKVQILQRLRTPAQKRRRRDAAISHPQYCGQ